MSRLSPTRFTTLFVLAFCLTNGSVGLRGVVEQGRRAPRPMAGRHCSTAASTTRALHARSCPSQVLLDGVLHPGNTSAPISLVAAGLVAESGALQLRACPLARRSGRSPPQLA